MQPTVKDIAEKILKLSPAARAYLAEVLLQSLDYEEDFPVSDEWINEIHSRCHEMDEERIELITAEDAFDQLRKKYL
ncbi:MAG: addiction module protein, partial [Candidatus Competibacter sp.]|nr:addiction module protein [Candidatus Competibacter sp.]